MPETPLQSPKKRETVVHAYAPLKRTWRRRLSGSLRSWWRVTFSRESYLSSLRSLLWVVPLTVLIWIYAEREQVVTLSNVTISVDPPPGQPGRLLIRFAPGTIHSIHAELRGPQALAEEVKDLLESNTIPLELDRDLSAGDHAIDVATVLNRDPRVATKGILVRNCVPAEVVVTVENITTVTVDVKPRPEDMKGLPPPVFSQSKIKVTLPEGDRKKAELEDRLYVYPNLKPYSEVLAQTGAHKLTNVALVPAFDNPSNTATITPGTVEVTVNRPKSEATLVVDPVSIWAAYPQTTLAEKLIAKNTSTTSKVTVIGPEEKIDALRNALQNGGIAPHATFDVDLSGNPETEKTATLNFVLPPGVKVIDEDANRTIKYTLMPRSRTDQ
jgi:hypothetical protein